MAKISVIVPVYGVEKYIEKCISSIVNQTFKDIEIIIVDDGTKDNSIKIVESSFNDKRIKIYHKENGGLASARNLGIKKATGEYLFFVDSDDFIDINALSDMYHEITNKDVDMVICDYYKYYENGDKIYENMIPFYEEDNNKCSVTAMPCAVCKLVKTKTIKENKISFLEKHYFEDNAIMPFVCAICPTFSYIKKPYYYYLQREGSILNKVKYDPKWEDIFDALDSLYKRFKDSKLLDKYHDELEYIYIEYLLHAPGLRFIAYKEGKKNILKINAIMKKLFPNWQKNKYYQKHNIKYKIICSLFYHNKLTLARILLRKREV